jgi:hypothetical protein
MPANITPKIVILSAVYFILVIVVLLLMDIGLFYFINNIVISILNWFNGLSLTIKLLILLVGGAIAFSAFLSITQRLSSLIGGLVFNVLPQNLFTVISAMILSIANTILNIIWLWKIPEHYDFWIVCELLLLTGFAWGLSDIITPTRDQMRRHKEQGLY